MSPIHAFRWRPMTFITTGIIAAWNLWFGTVLLALPLGPTRHALFRGPEALLGVHWWGLAFILAAFALVARLYLFGRPAGYWLQLFAMAVIVCWAGAWYAGPLSTAQPAYTFIAVLTVGLPYVHRIVGWADHVWPGHPAARAAAGRADRANTLVP